MERFERSRHDDFTTVGAKAARETGGAARPYHELFVRHALPFVDDPFKGAVERRVTPDDELTARCDARAAARALEDAAIDPREVDLILSSAMVPDHLTPSNAQGIQELTGCSRAAAISVESYCSSALAQLDLATGLVAAGRARYILCVQSHHLARVNDLTEPISPLFGDGSSAFVVGKVAEGRGILSVVRGGDPSLARAVTWVHPETRGARWWRDAAGPICPGSDDLEAARRFTDHLLAYPIDTLRQLCEETGFDPADAAALVAIQPIRWFQPAIADGMGVRLERVPTTFERFGHMGAVGFVANLVEARHLGLLRDGSPLLFYSHGAGMTRYGMLYRWTSPDDIQ